MKKDLDLAIDNFVKSSQTFYDELIDKLAALKEEYVVSVDEVLAALKKVEEAHKRAIRMLGTYRGERVYSITLDDYWSHKDIYDNENNYYILVDDSIEDPFVVWKGQVLFTYDRIIDDFVSIESKNVGDVYPVYMKEYKIRKMGEQLYVRRDKEC